MKTKRTVTENLVVERDVLLEEQTEEPLEDMEQAESQTEESRPENGQVEEGQTGESRPENDQIENGLLEECPEGVPEAPNEEEDEDAETPNEEEDEDAEIPNEENPDEPDNSTDNMTV